MSSALDYLCQKDDELVKYGKLSLVLKSFSLKRNLKTFLSNNKREEEEDLNLEFFDSLKIFILIYVILSHISLNGLLPYPIISCQLYCLYKLYPI